MQNQQDLMALFGKNLVSIIITKALKKAQYLMPE